MRISISCCRGADGEGDRPVRATAQYRKKLTYWRQSFPRRHEPPASGDGASKKSQEEQIPMQVGSEPRIENTGEIVIDNPELERLRIRR
jgi:hypothetical protein